MVEYQALEKKIKESKGVIFDMDGTLVNLNVDWEGLREALSQFVRREKGIDVEFRPLDQVHEMKEKFGKDFFFQLVKIIAEYETAGGIPPVREDMVRCYQSLAGKKIALYTMNTLQCAEGVVEHHLKRRPDIIICKDTCSEPKPSAKDLRKILSLWGLDSKDVVYIGDSEKDRLSGDAAGIQTYII